MRRASSPSRAASTAAAPPNECATTASTGANPPAGPNASSSATEWMARTMSGSAVRTPLDRPCAGKSNITTRYPASVSRGVSPLQSPAHPPHPCTSSTVGPLP